MIKVHLRSKQAREFATLDVDALVKASAVFAKYEMSGLARRDVLPALDSLATELMSAIEAAEEKYGAH
jgi:hypothetical protein